MVVSSPKYVHVQVHSKLLELSKLLKFVIIVAEVYMYIRFFC